MNREKQDSPPPRDTTLARLVASALESQTAATSGAACPDADLLSAYAEHALDADETARWESHFADCARCQQVLAVLTVSTEDPLTQQEIARLGQMVGKSVAPSESLTATLEISRQLKDAKVAKPGKHLAPWRWLLPAFGVAAVAALWFALRPTLPSSAPGTQITAEKVAVPPPPGQEAQVAQANVPPSSAVNAPATALPRKKEARSLDNEAASSVESATKQKDTLRNGARDEARNEDKKVTPAAQGTEADRVAPAAPPVATANGAVATTAAPPPPPATLQSEIARQQQSPQPSPSGTARLSAGNAVSARPLAARNTMAAMAKTAVVPVIFGTPNRGVQWRIGNAGNIERSTDQGKSWQPQPSGVTSDLLAGAAVSDKVAWIVGRADVILRTTDGEHWQRTTPPPAPSVNGAVGGLGRAVGGAVNSRVDAITSSTDWSGVQAIDALHATIVSPGGRRYATADGGRTWTLQP